MGTNGIINTTLILLGVFFLFFTLIKLGYI